MGLDLRVLPAYNVGSDFSIDVISLQRDLDLFELIAEVESVSGREVPKHGITTMQGSKPSPKYGYTKKTPYGEVIKGVQVKALRKKLKGYKTTDYKNRMFLFFVRNAPLELELWLYWK